MKKSPEQYAAEMVFESQCRLAAVRRANGQETAPLTEGKVPRVQRGPWASGDGLGVEPPLRGEN